MKSSKKCIVCGCNGKLSSVNNLTIWRCARCQLFWRESFDILLSHYENKSIDTSEGKMIARINNCRDRVEILERYISNLDYLCDIGCGEGAFLKILKEKGYQNIYGLEPSKQNFDSDLKIFKGRVEDLSRVIDQREIKIITMFHVIEHLTDPAEIVRQVYRTLPPGGILLIETPDSESYSFKKSNYNHPLVYAEHLYYFNKKNLKLLLTEIGFDVLGYGKRDFDQWNMSFKQALRRLGLGKFVYETKTKRQDDTSLLSTKKTNYQKKLLWPLRKVLSFLAISLGRLDYLWIVVQKPK